MVNGFETSWPGNVFAILDLKVINDAPFLYLGWIKIMSSAETSRI